MSTDREQVEDRAIGESTAFLHFFLLVSIAAGAMGAIGWFTSRNAVLALLLALSVATICLLVEVRFRLAVSKEALARGLALKDQTNKRPEDLRASIWQAVNEYTNVRRDGHPLAQARAKELLSNLGTEMSRLREGNLEVSLHHSHLYLVRLYEEVRRSMFATLLVRLADTWFRPNPQEYINRNLRTLERGVKMTRVFILQRAEDLSDDIVDIINRLTKAGADIRIAFEGSLAAELVIDMFLFDERMVVYTEVAPGDRAQSCHIHSNEAELQKARHLQERLVRDSIPASEFLVRFHPTPLASVSSSVARGGAPA